LLLVISRAGGRRGIEACLVMGLHTTSAHLRGSYARNVFAIQSAVSGLNL
jgi:hypothetical protein